MIKDANQFWLAILLCFLCSVVGFVLIGPWYLARLLQWKSFSQNHPLLMDPAVAPGSLAQRFQSAKWKLIAGLVVGACCLVLSLLAVLSLGAPAAAPR